MLISISQHAFQRAKERFSLNEKSLQRLSERAFSEGIKRKDVKFGKFGRFLDRLFLSKLTADNIRVYGEIIFFFRGSHLVTLYQLPNEYKKSITKRKKNE